MPLYKALRVGRSHPRQKLCKKGGIKTLFSRSVSPYASVDRNRRAVDRQSTDRPTRRPPIHCREFAPDENPNTFRNIAYTPTDNTLTVSLTFLLQVTTIPQKATGIWGTLTDPHPPGSFTSKHEIMHCIPSLEESCNVIVVQRFQSTLLLAQHARRIEIEHRDCEDAGSYHLKPVSHHPLLSHPPACRPPQQI